MLITIRKLKLIPLQEAEIKMPTYWVEFDSSLTSGQITLHSNTHPSELLAGKEISVETNQERIEGFRVLPKDIQELCQLTPLTQLGDYEVIGQVKAITFIDNAQEFIIDIWVNSCWFTITSDDAERDKVSEGDWVKFRAIGVSFWDEHL